MPKISTKTKTLEQMSDGELDAMLADSHYDHMTDEELDAELAKSEGGGSNPAIADTVNEMHPSFTATDRLMVKNLGTNIDDSIAYLQKQHPELEITQDSGEIVARKQGEKEFRKLDPDGFWTSLVSPTELAMDIGDVGYDVASGIGSTAATAAGGLAGNLPGAMAAGAGSSAGLEALRQGLGKYFGVNKDVSGTDVALAGGFGAATPLLFGSGVGAAQATKAALASGGKETAEGILAANKGLLGRAASKVGELTSGIKSDIIQTASKRLPEIDQLDEAGVGKFAAEARGQVADVIEKSRLGVGKAIEDTVDQIQAPIDLAPVRMAFDKEIGRVSAQMLENPTELLQQQLDSLTAQKASILGEGETVSGRSAWEIMQNLKELGKVSKTKSSGVEGRLGPTASLADKRMANAATSGAKTLKTQIDDATGGQMSVLNKQYQDNMNLRKQLKGFLKDDQSFYKKLSNIQSPNNRVEYEVLKGVDESYGTEIIPKAKLLTAYKHFSKAPWLAMSSEGTTSTSRTVPLGIAGTIAGAYLGANSGTGQGGAIIGGGLGGLAGATLGGPKAIRAYMSTARNMRYLEDQARKLTGGQPAGRAAAYGVWNMMHKGGEK